MGVILTLAGIALILLALWDVFSTVFVPRGRGALSAVIQRAVWRRIHSIARYRPNLLSIAGPLIMVTILATWTLLLVIGWALLLWPQLPGGFLIASGLNPQEQHGFLDALYLSLINIATLGYGDIVPRGRWMRITGPLDAHHRTVGSHRRPGADDGGNLLDSRRLPRPRPSPAARA